MEAILKTDHTFEDTSLSSNMQDYVEMIEILSRTKKVVRVKDIATNLKIKMPSVTAALQKLEEMGLINYERYGYVELTENGRKIAQNVYDRHTCLAEFFNSILKMEYRSADEVACRVEHQLTSEACSQIYKFIEFYKAEKAKKEQWTERLGGILEERALSELHQGDTATIVRLAGSGPFKKRLAEMGFRRGEQLKVLKYAPLNDPLEIRIKDYNISLRVDEARKIITKPINKQA